MGMRILNEIGKDNILHYHYRQSHSDVQKNVGIHHESNHTTHHHQYRVPYHMNTSDLHIFHIVFYSHIVLFSTFFLIYYAMDHYSIVLVEQMHFY